MKSINPLTLETIKEFEESSDKEIEGSLEKASLAFLNWKKSSIQDRKSLFLKLSTILKSKSDSLAKIISLEMGKLFSEAKAEVLKCSQVCEYFANNAENFLKDQKVDTDGSESFITFQPLGTVLAIMPWNFPFWQVLRFAAPTLMAGNVAILKHASNVSLCALEIENLFQEAGFPKMFLKPYFSAVRKFLNSLRTLAFML
jgi:succinate-semialdehyde dehydrogenase / glutarate-semialdehyde dehydrogenase